MTIKINQLAWVLVGITSFALSSQSFAHEHKKPTLDQPHAVVDKQSIISGGYQYQANYLSLPKEVDIKHAHGLTRDNDDNIYLAYESKTIDENTHAIAMFDKQGHFIRYIGDSAIAYGSPHGLDLVYENGKKYLYLSNNGQAVRKIDLAGNILWQSDKSPDTTIYQKSPLKYKPTDTATNPDSNQLYVADGYGSSTITERDKQTGDFTNKVWMGDNAGQHFKVPHGVTFDPRTNNILVADRENKRIVVLDRQGNFLNELKGEGISRVCNTDVWQEQLLVPNLNGTVAYLDKNSKLIDVIELNKVLGTEGHKHPHDAIFMSNGDIVIGTWNPGRLSYWKRLSK